MYVRQNTGRCQASHVSRTCGEGVGRRGEKRKNTHTQASLSERVGFVYEESGSIEGKGIGKGGTRAPLGYRSF